MDLDDRVIERVFSMALSNFARVVTFSPRGRIRRAVNGNVSGAEPFSTDVIPIKTRVR